MKHKLYQVRHSTLTYIGDTPIHVASHNEFVIADSLETAKTRYGKSHDLAHDQKVFARETTLESVKDSVLDNLQPYIPLGVAFAPLLDYIKAVHVCTYYSDEDGPWVPTEAEAARLILDVTTQIHKAASSWENLPEEQRRLPS